MENDKKWILGAVYIRTAADNPEQINEQEESIEEYCYEHGIKIVKTYKDVAQSGLSVERPALNQLIEDAAVRKFSVMVVTTPDRIARDLSIYHQLTEQVKKYIPIRFAGVVDYKEHNGVPTDILNPRKAEKWFDNHEEKDVSDQNASDAIAEAMADYHHYKLTPDNSEAKDRRVGKSRDYLEGYDTGVIDFANYLIERFCGTGHYHPWSE
jgi:hypothetical protein